MKKVIIDQPGYLGDIIYVMAIAQKYVSEGYDVVFPIFGEYLNERFEKNFPDILFIDVNACDEYKKYHTNRKYYEDDEYIYIPCRWSPSQSGDQHMKIKYEHIGLSYMTWRNIKIIRDNIAEQELIDCLGIEKNMKFNLINRNYSSQKKINAKVNYLTDNEFPNIEMSFVSGYSLFDWIGIIERAETIHTIHTSIHYILDVLPNITNEIHIYPRTEVNDRHERYNFLFEKNYIYH
jgi:hypothetical protein